MLALLPNSHVARRLQFALQPVTFHRIVAAIEHDAAAALTPAAVPPLQTGRRNADRPIGVCRLRRRSASFARCRNERLDPVPTLRSVPSHRLVAVCVLARIISLNAACALVRELVKKDARENDHRRDQNHGL